MRPEHNLDEELAELRAVVASHSVLGTCRHHPEQEASRTCIRCGDHSCDECSRGYRDGVCGICSVAEDETMAPRGRNIITALAVLWLVDTLYYVALLLGMRRFDEPWLLAFRLIVVALIGTLLVRVLRGSETGRHALVTLAGVGAVLSLINAEFVSAGSNFVCACFLLSPSVSAYLSVRTIRGRRTAVEPQQLTRHGGT